MNKPHVKEHTRSVVVCEPVELVPLSSPPPVVDSPAGLLRADVAPMGFRPRPEIDELLNWCHAEREWSARLLVGPGGQGKTRTARHLAHLMAQQGWATLVLADTTDPSELAVLAQVNTPLLVIIDYAETRIAQLAQLSTWLRQSEPVVRLLLLARTGGGWQTDAAATSPHLAYLATQPAHHLGALEPSPAGRRDAWAEATAALATALPTISGYQHIAWAELAARLAVPALAGERYRTILAVQMDALAALLQRGLPLKEGRGASAADILLTHEISYWTKAAPTHRVALSGNLQHRVVAAATLWGAAEEDEALAVLRATPGLRELREHELLDLADWVTALYHEPGRYWSRMQPDRLAEHLLDRLIGPDAGPSPLLAGAAAASPAQLDHALTLLAQATVHHPRLAQAISQLVTSYPSTAGAAALNVATRAEKPIAVLDALHRVCSRADLATLQALSLHLPRSSLVLAQLATTICSSLVEKLRAQPPAPQQTNLPVLAAALHNLANRLRDVGQRQPAVAAAQEAVDIYRWLVEMASDAYLPNLALSLTNLANHLAAVGQREQALAAAQEAVQHYRQLTDQEPDLLTDELGNAERLLAALTDDLQ